LGRCSIFAPLQNISTYVLRYTAVEVRRGSPRGTAGKSERKKLGNTYADTPLCID